MTYRYITLMSGLPALAHNYDVDIPPISRYQLDRRLSLLSFEHRELLEQIESVLHWDHLNSHYDDQELIDHAKAILSQLSEGSFESIRDIIVWRFDLRTILAAFRYRLAGREVVGGPGEWGVGEMVHQIGLNWHHPTFNLEAKHPWVVPLKKMLESDDTMGTERLLFDTAWNLMRKVSETHNFDFTAVVCYVLMWNIVSRWSAYDADRGVEQFQWLVKDALGEFSTKNSFSQLESQK